MAVIDFVKKPNLVEKVNKKLDFYKPLKTSEQKLEDDINKLKEEKAQLIKDKATFEEVAMKKIEQGKEQPKRRGRKPGSKNKLKVEDAVKRDS